MNDQVLISSASADDLEDILALQKLAFLSEAELYDDHTIQPLHQSLEELQEESRSYVILKATLGSRIIGSIRARLADSTCHIEKLIVSPESQNQGIGQRLMKEIEGRFPDAERFELFTGKKSPNNIHLYEKLGYRIFREERATDNLTFVFMEKPA